MAKIVPSERLRRELDAVLAGVAERDDPVEAVARLGARLIMQQALEDELTEFLGRERYARAEDGDGDASAVYRNGYEPRTVKTTSGPMELERPRLRNATDLGLRARCSVRVSRARTRLRR
jgi:putative transposase